MQNEAVAVNLVNIGNGTALQLFQHELDKVLSNIKDPNTDLAKARSINLTIKFIPHGDRSGMQTVISCSSKLATVPAVPAGTMFIAKNKEGEFQAYSHDIRQEELFGGGEEDKSEGEYPVAENVIAMKQAQ